MRTLAFASRNTKEILREPINLMFGLLFPLIIFMLLSMIQANIPVSLFEVENLSPAIAVFGLAFISLFSGMLLAKDRSSSFLMRLFSSPLTPMNFILGYTLPLFPMAMIQSAVCFGFAVIMGLELNLNVLIAIVTLIPTALLFIAIGLLAGSTLTDKQVGGICGALLTNLVAWLSGAWFDLSLVGGSFERIANALPFVHAVEATKAALAGNINQIFPHLWWVIGYAVVIVVLAIFFFNHQMKNTRM